MSFLYRNHQKQLFSKMKAMRLFIFGLCLLASSCSSLRDSLSCHDTGLISRAGDSYTLLWGQSYGTFSALNPLPPNAWELAQMRKSLASKGKNSSYYTLMLVLEFDRSRSLPLSDGARARILCDALGCLSDVSDFGYVSLSGARDALAGKAILETGNDALPYLLPLLDDLAKVYVTNTIENAVISRHGMRKCDYAYRYACLILGQQCRFSLLPEERDLAIERIRAEVRVQTKPREEPSGKHEK